MLTSIRILEYSLLTFLSCLLVSTKCFAQAAPAVSQPMGQDQIVFLNGDRISGRLVEVTKSTIRFKTESMGELTVKWHTVKEVKSSDRWMVIGIPQRQAVPITYSKFGIVTFTQANGTPLLKLDKEPALPLTGELTAQFGDRSFSPQDLSSCHGPFPQAPFTPQGTSWVLGFEAPETMVNGTQSKQTIGGSISMDFCEKTKSNHSIISIYGQHSRSWNIHQPFVTTDIFDGYVEQKHNFHGPSGAGIYGGSDFIFNTSLGMALQKSFGIGFYTRGFSKNLFKGHFTSSGKVDLRYFNERFYSSSPSLDLAGIHIEEQVRYQYKTFSVTEHSWIVPMLNDVHALQGRAELEPAIKLNSWLSVDLDEIDDYLGNAPAARRKNYLSSSLTLKIHHGSN